MGIVVGTTLAKLKAAGINIKNLSKKGVRTTAEKLGLNSSSSSTAGIATGSIKPSIPNTVSIPSPVSGIIMAGNAVGNTQTGKSLAQTFVDVIPDIPGTAVDDKVKNFIVDHPLLSAGAAAIAVGTGIVVTSKLLKKKPKKKTPKKKPSSKKKSSSKKKKSKSKSGYGTEAAYNRKGGKKVYYTKNKQPYIKLANGQSRFIKKSR